MKTFVAQAADQWRKWLVEHYDSDIQRCGGCRSDGLDDYSLSRIEALPGI